MMLIIGLGNPGKKYQKTRHNAGFAIVQNWLWKNKFPPLKLIKKFQSLISATEINNQKILAALPQTYMNQSGSAIKKLKNYHRVPIENILVAYDEIDLPLGVIKIKKTGGSAGHKGVASIINSLKTKDFIRLRIGIQPAKKPKNLEKFVLQKFNQEETKIFPTIKRQAAEKISEFLNQ